MIYYFRNELWHFCQLLPPPLDGALDTDLGAWIGLTEASFSQDKSFFVIFSHMDFRIGVSGEKFHEEIDFDV